MNADPLAVLAGRAVAAQGLAHDLPSPCVSVCRMDTAQGFCTGCLRTLDEIAGWGHTDDTTRRRIWRAIELRARTGLWGDGPTGPGEGASA
ncbi:DUF1289 domain-containing protein [Variovorax ginsengisoli]|uniref:Fe-S protein YdhL (DUF1289 family) n=1 Tax=Variovorax ginsengisoli TaxID=363844 RepID=A0ABT9S2X0_9BURK|nr:DUF1289 domain-containing protein [Variovorax ginsengisoli]MDP9898264.1 putative Fe-S protein YdhL (DUF1289 family) [Variovorax ginsengisoli]